MPSSVTTIEIIAFYCCDNLVLFAEVASMPSGWEEIDCDIYFSDMWEYVNGVPTIK